MTARRIGDAIRFARITRKMSQRELGAQSGYRQAMVSKVERGSTQVRLQTVLDLLEYLGLEIRVVGRNEDRDDRRSARRNKIEKAVTKFIVRALSE